MPLGEGTRLGRYEIRSKIGEGGMGEVYLAWDTKLDRKVALKILPPELAANPDRMRRFVQEAQAASALNHPNIITVHEIDETDSGHFIATEFIDGETLRARLRRVVMNLSEALDIAAQTAGALAAAHAASIVHRDIKPENIMLRHDGIVKVLDFGLAKLTERVPRKSIDAEAETLPVVNTELGVVLGTFAYMSPEQARGKNIDVRSDIFSLGIVLYEMLAGDSPFGGDSKADVVAAILEREPMRLAQLINGVPSELERIVGKCLQKNCDYRYQTVSDLVIDLRALKEQLEFEARLELSAPSRPSGSEVKGQRESDVINSIAVLPLLNVSGDPETDYLSDGISESLINKLCQLRQLKVIARTSSFKFRGKEVDPKEAAQTLGVRAILTGRVIPRGDQLQISVELIDTYNESQLWGEQYHRPSKDLLVLQTEISEEIADRLRLRLSGSEEEHLTKLSTSVPDAYELLLKGRFYWKKSTIEARKKALEYCHEAIVLDPTYALAYANLAHFYVDLVGETNLNPKDAQSRALAAASQALRLDPNLAEAHVEMARIKLYSWKWAEAERGFKRAIELNPNYSRAHNWYGAYLSVVGRDEQALAEIKRARDLDPLSVGINANVGSVLAHARRYDEAIESLKRTLELDQNFPFTHIFLGYAYVGKGLYLEAVDEYQKAIDFFGPNTALLASIGYALARSGQRKQGEEVLNQLLTTTEYVSFTDLAILHAGLENKEQALKALEHACAARDPQLQHLPKEPAYDCLRTEGRFQHLLRQVGVPVT
jgi:serine/threonine protein kinase/Tfp pilus assembly protein PilF